MTEKLCKNCRWWDETPYLGGGECDNKKVIDGDYDKDGADVSCDGDHGDYVDYENLFSTGPNFGCVHWEEKEDS